MVARLVHRHRRLRSSGSRVTAGGLVALAGIVIALFVSFWFGEIITAIGLVAFGYFVTEKWL